MNHNFNKDEFKTTTKMVKRPKKLMEKNNKWWKDAM